MNQIEARQIFNLRFTCLTGNSPFAWQERLFLKFISGEIPAACDIPTGLGKTSVITIWLLALAETLISQESARSIPLRLVYVVDRRVVVDQSTDEALRIIEKLKKAEKETADNPLTSLAQALQTAAFSSDDALIALSSLRGQLADNREWFLDPSRPAIIIGTVDMIGSRLLFSGYGGVGRNYQSMQAGLLGQDALLIVDEAHLSPSYVTTLKAIQQRIVQSNLLRPFAVMQLSATIPTTQEQHDKYAEAKESLFDQAAECQNEEARRRLLAEKLIEWIDVEQQPEKRQKERQTKIKQQTIEKIVANATGYEGQPVSIVIYVSTVNLVNEIAERLIEQFGKDAEKRILRLTGEMRGKERDELAEREKFKAFLPYRNREAIQQTHYLIATSCAEVGVNLDADHGICDLTSFDSMIQRIGRINRFGKMQSTISVIIDRAGLEATASDIRREEDHQEKLYAATAVLAEIEKHLQAAKDKEEKKRLAAEKKKAVESKKQLEDNGSQYDPQFADFERAERLAYYTYLSFERGEKVGDKIKASPLALRQLPPEPRAWPVPPIVPALDEARLDDWSMTSLKQKDYPRPLVAYWLRGVMKDDSVQTTLCWRADLDYATVENAASMARVIPVAPRERAVLATFRAEGVLKTLAKQSPNLCVVQIDASGEYNLFTLKELAEQKEMFKQIAYATLLLPLKAGGLERDGNVSAKAKGRVYTDAVNEENKNKEKEDEWRRFVLARQENGLFEYSELQSNGTLVAPKKDFPTLKEAFDDCRRENQGICVNAKELLQAIDNTTNQTDEEKNTKAVVIVAYFLKRTAPEHYLPQDSENELASLRLSCDEARTVDEHNADVAHYASAIAKKIGLDDEMVEVLYLAGAWHDRGKNREWWQAAIGNPVGATGWQPLAKSTHNSFDHSLNQYYRHEFGSLVEALADETLGAHPHCELILHLIAAHHGYARPHFPERAFDRSPPKAVSQTIALETMQRFARLQRRYGWWQLAYLEAVLKAADALASRDFSEGKLRGVA